MADFTTFDLQYNTGTDAAPVFTGTAIAFGGSAGANELRWALAGAGAAGTSSASWPYYTRPGAVTAVNELWAFTADTTGSKIATYDGTNGKANVARWHWDNLGTFVAAPQFSMFGDSSHTAPVAGTQPGAFAGSPIVNGHATDTSSTSYCKINAHDTIETSATVYKTAGAVGTSPTGTTGAAGLTATTSANWLNANGAWQSAQGWIQGIILRTTPAATTLGYWFWTTILFTGPNMSTVVGGILPVYTLQYSYA